MGETDATMRDGTMNHKQRRWRAMTKSGSDTQREGVGCGEKDTTDVTMTVSKRWADPSRDRERESISMDAYT